MRRCLCMSAHREARSAIQSSGPGLSETLPQAWEYAKTIRQSQKIPAVSCPTISNEEKASMDFLKLSLQGLDEFLAYFGMCIGFVVLFLTIYVHITPYKEIALIRQGN